MLPLIIIPAVIVTWLLAKKHAERQLEQRVAGGDIDSAVDRALARRQRYGAGAPPRRPMFGAHGELPPPPPPAMLSAASPIGNTATYMDHLREASAAAAALNLVRPAALNADVASLMRAPAEAVQALHVLAQPIDTLTVQRDLNLLGATPPLAESGQLDARTTEAVRAFQERFRQVPTGVVDDSTAIALRYSVGVVNFQNQMQAGA